MKCPYCGHENSTNHCEKCFAVFHVEMPKESPKETEPVRTRKRNKEMKEHGT